MRFTLLDAIVLVAATALGLAISGSFVDLWEIQIV